MIASQDMLRLFSAYAASIDAPLPCATGRKAISPGDLPAAAQFRMIAKIMRTGNVRLA
jgi:hypothetical protein